MKTRDLVNVLVADRAATSSPPGRAIVLAVGIGAVISASIFLPLIGVRPDITNAAFNLRFLVKVAIALSLAVAAVGLTTRISRPDGSSGFWIRLLGSVPLILAVAVAAELIIVPPSQWQTRLFGVHWLACLALIPLFSIPPLAGLLFALKHAAPRDGGLAGAIAGVAAGGIAATIYVAHCPDDSPLFVAVWYTLAVGIISLLGHFAGRWWLRW